MKRYNGKETVPRGVYLNLSTWELIQLYGDTRVLPGGSEVKFIKVPAPLAVLGGPFAGLFFIIFLPFAGIIGILSFIAYKVGWWALALGHKALQPVMLGWKPGQAYLTRKGGTSKGRRLAEDRDRELDNMTIGEIEQEIARRRREGEK